MNKISKISNQELINLEKMSLSVLEIIQNENIDMDKKLLYSRIGKIRRDILDEMTKRVLDLEK